MTIRRDIDRLIFAGYDIQIRNGAHNTDYSKQRELLSCKVMYWNERFCLRCILRKNISSRIINTMQKAAAQFGQRLF